MHSQTCEKQITGSPQGAIPFFLSLLTNRDQAETDSLTSFWRLCSDSESEPPGGGGPFLQALCQEGRQKKIPPFVYKRGVGGPEIFSNLSKITQQDGSGSHLTRRLPCPPPLAATSGSAWRALLSPPPSQGQRSNCLQTPPLGGDPGDGSNDLFCSSGVSFSEPSDGDWGRVWPCWHLFSISISHTLNRAPGTERHMELEPWCGVKQNSTPVLPVPLQPLTSSSRPLGVSCLRGPLSKVRTTLIKSQTAWVQT